MYRVGARLCGASCEMYFHLDWCSFAPLLLYLSLQFRYHAIRSRVPIATRIYTEIRMQCKPQAKYWTKRWLRYQSRYFIWQNVSFQFRNCAVETRIEISIKSLWEQQARNYSKCLLRHQLRPMVLNMRLGCCYTTMLCQLRRQLSQFLWQLKSKP